MVTITYESKQYRCNENETVLDCLTRHGVSIPSSCRSGICQSCLMRAVKGELTAAAQKDLKPTLIARQYFLACQCEPAGHLEVTLPDDDASSRVHATVVNKIQLNRDIMRIAVKPETTYEYRAGQFLNVIRDNSISRSYSIASVPELDDVIELHVRKLPDGRISTWLHDEVQVGERITLSGPLGNCFYLPGNPQQSLLLVGTGSGLAPLWGILRDALHQGHEGAIYLFHGSHTPDGLYLVDELKSLTQTHENFHYEPCVSGEPHADETNTGRANEVALQRWAKLNDWRIYLCGHPQMVNDTKRKAFLAGASLKEIFADPFVHAS